MSNKVRYYLEMDGSSYAGKHAIEMVESYRNHYGISHAPSTLPCWQRVVETFKRIPANGVLRNLVIVREPKRTNAKKSTYIQLVSARGIGRRIRGGSAQRNNGGRRGPSISLRELTNELTLQGSNVTTTASQAAYATSWIRDFGEPVPARDPEPRNPRH